MPGEECRSLQPCSFPRNLVCRERYRELMHSHGNPKGGGRKFFTAGQPCKIVEDNEGGWRDQFAPRRPGEGRDLSSQTKCNTSLRRCCHGADLQAALSGRSMRDCRAFCQWQLGPANRGSSGSLAINDLSGVEP